MRMISNYNDPANYVHRAFGFGFKDGKAPEKPVFVARDQESVLLTPLPYNGMPIEQIESTSEDIDLAILEEIGRSKYLTSLMIYQFVRLRGFVIERTRLRKKLNKMMKLRLIREYEIKTPDAVRGIRVYDLDYKGHQIARKMGVCFNRGNAYFSTVTKLERGLFDTAETIKRILVGNMIVLGCLMNGAKLQRFGIMETQRRADKMPVKDGCIIRTAANVQLDEESLLIYEVVRSTPYSMGKLADKVSRYYTLVNDCGYREDNYYRNSALPQLVICGESFEHCVRIDQYLRGKGLISERDPLLYTDDLLHLQQTLKNLYELDELGHRAWYCLPAKETAADMGRSA